MDTKKMEELILAAVGDEDLRSEEIPAIDLYLDQILSLALKKKQESSSRFQDRVLTKTMVNNYSKDGLIRPIKGKKYSKEHILQMLLVSEMKNTLSIGEIRCVLQGLYQLPDYSQEKLDRVYTRYLEAKERQRAAFVDLVMRYVEESGYSLENDEDFLVMLLSLANLSSYLKNTVQELLEETYPAPPEEAEMKEREKEEKKAEKEKEKKEKAKKKEEKKAEKEKKAEESAETVEGET